jgi:ankyrin repeat protein
MRMSNINSPLHKAIFNPGLRVLMVKLLVENGADVNLANTTAGETGNRF